MIQRMVLDGFHKKFGGEDWKKKELTAFFHKERTFCPIFRHKKPGIGGDVTRSEAAGFRDYANRYAHLSTAGPRGKQRKYLLITWSFPHFPQVCPQGFSTEADCWGYALWIYITGKRGCSQIAHFLDCRNFYHGGIFVQKIILDRGRTNCSLAASRRGQFVTNCVEPPTSFGPLDRNCDSNCSLTASRR